MSVQSKRQFCAICAWRENCAKKFCVPDGGAHCPDFSRDVTIKVVEENGEPKKKDEDQKQEKA
ncbi:MAG: hypothetical protein HYS23_07740 [Geobacter sp.]|nr:hypothetical protein [Geobacter sp.]